MNDEIAVKNDDFWFKIVGMLQQNWATIEPFQAGYVVYFIGDNSGIFDQLEFIKMDDAERQLLVNGFTRYAQDNQARNFITPPQPPFYKSRHPNGAIYSSGRFWKPA